MYRWCRAQRIKELHDKQTGAADVRSEDEMPLGGVSGIQKMMTATGRKTTTYTKEEKMKEKEEADKEEL